MNNLNRSISYFAIPILKYKPIIGNPNWREDKIIDKVCEYYGITYIELRSKCRERKLVTARFICMHLMRKNTKLTVMAIAKLFKKDHTSCIHGVRTLQNLLQVDETIREDLSKIEDLILYR